MSAHSHTALAENRELLGELLHSVSQPLTTLRCSLELSLAEAVERRQQTITTALEQTEAVIAMIQLMREHLDAEQGEAKGPPVGLTPILTSLIGDLATWAALREVHIRVMGTCPAELPVNPFWLRRAFEYLITAMIERQPAGGEITLWMMETPSGVLLRLEGERGFEKAQLNSNRTCDSAVATMRWVRLAIATRVLEKAGATLGFDDGARGVVLRLPVSRGSAI
jgi:signal transduction histidine kinase